MSRTSRTGRPAPSPKLRTQQRVADATSSVEANPSTTAGAGDASNVDVTTTTPDHVLAKSGAEATQRLSTVTPGGQSSTSLWLSSKSQAASSLGPTRFERAKAAPKSLTLDEGGTAALHDDGAAVVNGVSFDRALPLETLMHLDISAHVAPLCDAKGAACALFRSVDDDGKASFRFEVLGDGPVPHTGGQLLVHDGDFLVVGSNDKVSDADGRFLGFLRDPHGVNHAASSSETPVVAVRLQQSSSWRRRLERSTRNSVLQPRRDADPSGTTIWENFDGWVVHPQHGALQEVGGFDGVFTDEGGRAFRKTIVDGDNGARLISIVPAADGVLADNALVHKGRLVHRPASDSVVGVVTSSQDLVLLQPDNVQAGQRVDIPAGPWGPSRSVAVLRSAKDALELHVVKAESSAQLLLASPAGDVGVFSARPTSTTDGSANGTFVPDDATQPSLVVRDGVLSKVLAEAAGRWLLQEDGRSTLHTEAAVDGDRPATPMGKTPTFALQRNGVVDEVVVGTRRYGALHQASTSASRAEQVADALLDALSSFAVQPENFNRHQTTVLLALKGVLDDDGVFGDASRADRKTAVRNEMVAGQGPLMQHAFGALASGAAGLHAVLDAACGQADTAKDAFVYAVEGGASAMRQRASGFTCNAQAHGLGLFRVKGPASSAGGVQLRPATIDEVKTHFDHVTQGGKMRSLRDCPRAQAVTYDDETQMLTLRAEGFVREVPVDTSRLQDGHPRIEDITAWLGALPLQALRTVERVELGAFDPNGQAQYLPHDGTLRFNPSPIWQQPGQGESITLHEVLGHGLEQGNPHIYRLLMQARVLDGALAGAWAGTDDPYGDTNLAESFAVGMQEFAADPDKTWQERPHFATLVCSLLTTDGEPFDVTTLGAKFADAQQALG